MKTLFFLKAKCGSTGRDFYIRHDFAADDRWVLTYGLKEIPTGNSANGSSMEVDYSSVRVGPQYKCPHCGRRSFYRCSQCGEYTCNIGEQGEKVKCAHCGHEGTIGGYIQSVEAKNTGSGQ